MKTFEAACEDCPRLSALLAEVRRRHPDYHARPVPPFGASRPRLLVVGLAPGLHGANRTGRPFTGDYAGILLYATLYRFGFANRPVAEHAADGLELIDCRITNAVKCLPPQNKPTPEEIKCCNKYLASELQALDKNSAVLALGQIAHHAVLQALGVRARDFPFGHGRVHHLPRLTLFDSYHCSRYNTQTRRLTPAMFEAVVAAIRSHLERS